VASTLRISGLREVQRAFAKMAITTEVGLRAELLKVAEPVAATAREKISRYPGASIGTIGPRASVTGVFVTQRARKVSGRRGDFGALQMTVGFMPALEEHEEDIVEAAEQALDIITAANGFR
jgi:hypothetical protein